MTKNINIMSLEAKDVINGNYQIKEKTRYKASLDYSLDTIFLHTIKKKFSFIRNRKLFTNSIINLTFNLKEENIYNIVDKETGEVIEEVLMKVGIKDYLHDKQIELRNPNLTYKIKYKGKSSSELREHLYENGFKIGDVNYVRFKRSSGSSRVGKCLFIDKKLYSSIMKWSLMGIEVKDGDKIDLASLEAYISLTLSSIIDTIEIKPNEILMVDDYESTFSEIAMVTKIAEDNSLVTKEEVANITNSIWDGQSLLDSSKFSEKYSDKGMLLLRNRFFKSCCFNTNIQQFFIDNNITNISQLNGKTLATDISQIKLITTPSSIKYLKFGTFDDYLDKLEDTFGIVKYDKPTHYFESRKVQTHYQLLNTLEFSRDEMRDFLSDSLNYIRLLKSDVEVMRNHLKMPVPNEEDNYMDIKKIDSVNDMIYTLLKINDKISRTNMYTQFRTDLVSSYIKNIRSGHIFVEGNYSVLMGNGYEMLEQSIGRFNGESKLEIDEVISYRFKDNERLIGIRSPHVTFANVWCMKNGRNDLYDKYFNLSPQIVCINSIGNNVLERLSGCDFDSDTIMITNDKLLVKKANENYGKFLVPTSMVVSKKAERLYTNWHKFDLDKKTSVNKIGEIINLSQVLNSYIWELKLEGKPYDEVYRDVSQLSVMSCIEIDRAKKEFVIDNQKELDKLREKYSDLIKEKPMFFYHLPSKDANTANRDIEKYRNYNTPMDYLEDIVTIETKKIRAKRGKIYSLKDIFTDVQGISISEANYKQAKKFLEIISELKAKITEIWSSDDIESGQKFRLAEEENIEFFDRLGKMKLTTSTIKKIMCDTNSRNQRKTLIALFNTNKKEVVEMLLDLKEEVGYLEEDSNGELYIYGVRYTKKYEKIPN